MAHLSCLNKPFEQIFSLLPTNGTFLYAPYKVYKLNSRIIYVPHLALNLKFNSISRPNINNLNSLLLWTYSFEFFKLNNHLA